MSRLRLALGLCALVCCFVEAREASAVWPRFRTPSASVLKPHENQYFGFGNPPPFRWGWFGTQYHTRRIDQTGFYTNYYYQYGYWQGYH